MELKTSDLKVNFHLVRDRFHSELSVRIGQDWSTILRSIEGNESTPWPPSPPWQQIVNESLGQQGKSVLLGVGQSGTGHWSISIDEQDGGLLFDIACKISKEAGFLGSTWQVGEGWELRDVWSDTMLLANANHTATVVRLHASHGELSLRNEETPNWIVLHPLAPQSSSKPYRWALQANALFP